MSETHICFYCGRRMEPDELYSVVKAGYFCHRIRTYDGCYPEKDCTGQPYSARVSKDKDTETE